jgi:hypothetical protein
MKWSAITGSLKNTALGPLNYLIFKISSTFINEKIKNIWLQRRTVFIYFSAIFVSQGSSVSIVSGYGLDDRAIEIRSAAEAKGFFL